jgi:hypothetical protein
MPAWYYHLPWLLLAETECLTPLSVSVLIFLQSGVMCIVGQGRKHDQLVFSPVSSEFLWCFSYVIWGCVLSCPLGVSLYVVCILLVACKKALLFPCMINPIWHPSLNSVSILLAPVIHQLTYLIIATSSILTFNLFDLTLQLQPYWSNDFYHFHESYP